MRARHGPGSKLWFLALTAASCRPQEEFLPLLLLREAGVEAGGGEVSWFAYLTRLYSRLAPLAVRPGVDPLSGVLPVRPSTLPPAGVDFHVSNVLREVCDNQPHVLAAARQVSMRSDRDQPPWSTALPCTSPPPAVSRGGCGT